MLTDDIFITSIWWTDVDFSYRLHIGHNIFIVAENTNPLKNKKKNTSDLWPIRLLFLCDLQTIVYGRHRCIGRGLFRVFWKAYGLTISNNDNKRLFDVIRTYRVDGTMVTTDFYIQFWLCHNVYARVNHPDRLWGLDGPLTDVWQNSYTAVVLMGKHQICLRALSNFFKYLFFGNIYEYFYCVRWNLLLANALNFQI